MSLYGTIIHGVNAYAKSPRKCVLPGKTLEQSVCILSMSLEFLGTWEPWTDPGQPQNTLVNCKLLSHTACKTIEGNCFRLMKFSGNSEGMRMVM